LADQILDFGALLSKIISKDDIADEKIQISKENVYQFKSRLSHA
jgi:hypothetical protein